MNGPLPIRRHTGQNGPSSSTGTSRGRKCWNGIRQTLTYWDLYREVNRFANALKARGIKRGDRVAIYMPMIPELAIAMLACARIGTMEVESALVDHQDVAEAAVVGSTDEIRGTAIVAFVTVKVGVTASTSLEGDLKQHVAGKIGAIARPQRIIFSGDLPKTRSGKIMRRLLRDIADGRVLGDTTTLADAEVVESLRQQYEEREEA